MSRKKRKPPKLDEETQMIFDVLSQVKEETKENTQTPVPRQVKPKTCVNLCVNTTNFVMNRINALQKTAKKLRIDEDLQSVHEDYLLDLLQDSTQISMVVRDAYLGGKNAWYGSRREEICEHLPVKVGHPNGTIIRITVPPLIGTRFKGSYDVYWNVKIVLEEYYSKHERPALYGKKLLLIYKKYAPNLSADFTCDNDNWEAKRVTNAISEALLYSDNAEHFSMMYTAVKSEFSFVEATVIRIEDMEKFADYILDPAPAQPL